MTQQQKKVPFGLAIIPLLFMIGAMAVTIVVFEGYPHIPLIFSTAIAALVAWKLGYKWNMIEESMYKGIRLALPAVVILILIGLIIGTWIGGGIVATLIYYGLKIISPSFFLVSILLLCAMVSLAIGSSWSTAATVGVAGMGIGLSLNIPAGMVAGAIISGAYFGDKMSPLSDTTNLASGVAGSDLFDHIKHMTWTTIPGLIIAAVAFGFLGKNYTAETVNEAEVNAILTGLSEQFVITSWLLLVPLAVVVLVVRKVPAMPAIMIGVVLGMIAQIAIQGDTIGNAMLTLYEGFSIESDNDMLKELLNRGGISSMMYTVSLVVSAMTFGGVMEQTGMLRAIVDQILKFARSTGSLISATVGSAIVTNLSTSDQYLAIIMPGRMYKEAYEKKNLASKNLSRAVEDGGTLTSVFVPWNTCGAFMFASLGVHPFTYGPYAILNYVVPIISIILAYTGISIAKAKKAEKVNSNEGVALENN